MGYSHCRWHPKREKAQLPGHKLNMTPGDSTPWKPGTDTQITFSARISFQREMFNYIILSLMSSK